MALTLTFAKKNYCKIKLRTSKKAFSHNDIFFRSEKPLNSMKLTTVMVIDESLSATMHKIMALLYSL